MVGEDPVTARGLQGRLLQVRVLVGGADPGVSNSSHADSLLAHQRPLALLLRIARVRHIVETTHCSLKALEDRA
jgi:hypothetical protein